MFTGIIESTGHILSLRRTGEGGVIRVEHLLSGEPLVDGESVAVDGVCLTVVRLASGHFEADLSPETLAKTNLGDASPGKRVNLERALAVGQRLGGHFVQGHVEATGVFEGARSSGDGYVATLRVPESVRVCLLPKGSVAVDGISLTVARLEGDLFDVALIPHTWEVTNLADRRAGDRVNLESDMLVRAVVETLRQLRDGGSLGGQPPGGAEDAPESA